MLLTLDKLLARANRPDLLAAIRQRPDASERLLSVGIRGEGGVTYAIEPDGTVYEMPLCEIERENDWRGAQ